MGLATYKCGLHTGTFKSLWKRYRTAMRNETVIYFIRCDNVEKVEKAIHAELREWVCVNNTGNDSEWFACGRKAIDAAVKKHLGTLVSTPDATYWEMLAEHPLFFIRSKVDLVNRPSGWVEDKEDEAARREVLKAEAEIEKEAEAKAVKTPPRKPKRGAVKASVTPKRVGKAVEKAERASTPAKVVSGEDIFALCGELDLLATTSHVYIAALEDVYGGPSLRYATEHLDISLRTKHKNKSVLTIAGLLALYNTEKPSGKAFKAWVDSKL